MKTSHALIELTNETSFSGAKFFIYCLFLIFLTYKSMAVNMSDSVPGFLMPGIQESSESTVIAKTSVEAKRNTSGSNTVYCNREDSDNIFCNKNNANLQRRGSINYNNDKNSDKTKMVDVSTSAKTSSNQSALQDQHTRDALQQQQNNLSLPIKPSKDVDVNVGQQQVQIKIKY